jgi:hypothetical protein
MDYGKPLITAESQNSRETLYRAIPTGNKLSITRTVKLKKNNISRWASDKKPGKNLMKMELLFLLFLIRMMLR